jgi:hypothetical protein
MYSVLETEIDYMRTIEGAEQEFGKNSIWSATLWWTRLYSHCFGIKLFELFEELR